MVSIFLVVYVFVVNTFENSIRSVLYARTKVVAYGRP